MKRIKALIKRYFQNFSYFYYYLRHRVFIRMLLSISVGLLDGLGLAMFLPLLQMIDGNQGVNGEGLGSLSFLVDGLIALGIEFTMSNVLIILASFFIFKGVAVYFSRLYEVMLRQYFVNKIRRTLTVDMSELSYKHFVLSDVGRIQNTMTGEVSKISQAYFNYFDALQYLILVIVYMVFAFFVDAQFALLITIGGVLTNFLFKTIFDAMKKASSKLTKRSHVFQGLVIQFVANFKYLKATGVVHILKGILLRTADDVEENNTQIGKLHALVNAAREPLLIVVVCLVIFLQVMALGGSLATILVSLLFFYRALSSLIYMQGSYNNFLSVSGSMENMTAFQRELKHSKEKNGNHQIQRFTERIVLEKISFGYGHTPIIDEISLTIRKNTTVAFVGESGSGKTTLVNLIAGLTPIDGGRITVDGIDMCKLDINSYRSRVGYISQEPVIFNDTIFNNVTLWNHSASSDNQLFQDVLEQASIRSFIETLDDREQTLLGNNGINLSGGQKQRISIARELYKDIDILILDEATSALDSETEHSIQESISRLKGRMTLLVVAHRLSTVRNADYVILLDKGKITAVGTFDELLLTSPKFKKMVELQDF